MISHDKMNEFNSVKCYEEVRMLRLMNTLRILGGYVDHAAKRESLYSMNGMVQRLVYLNRHDEPLVDLRSMGEGTFCIGRLVLSCILYYHPE